MYPATRRARVKAYGKVNLCLEVLGRRVDGFHEIRTIFQTITLADTIDMRFMPGREAEVALVSDVDIPDNLVVRAARAVLEATGARGLAEFELVKRIPMGGGLGGGSADAAAVIRALPALAGTSLTWQQSISIGATLGSDVPFFLVGGTALGLGRGTELYPLPDAKAEHVLLVAPGIHVATPEAYRALQRPPLSDVPADAHNASQALALQLGQGGDWTAAMTNDFESAVFTQVPILGEVKERLLRAGAKAALMSGSGSSLFGVFENATSCRHAAAQFADMVARPVAFLPSARYRNLLRQQLRD